MDRTELMQKITEYMDQDQVLARRIENAASDRERYDIERLRRIRGVVLHGYFRQLERSLVDDARPVADKSVRSAAAI